MRRLFLATVLLPAAGVACGAFSSTGDATPSPATDAGEGGAPVEGGAPPNDGGQDADTSADSGPADAGACDPSKPWGAPTPLANANNLAGTLMGLPSPDALTLYINATSGTTTGIYFSVRTTTSEAFSAPSLLDSPINTQSNSALHPSVTAAGTSLFFARTTAGASTIYFSIRPNKTSTFGSGNAVGNLGGTNEARDPFIMPDGLTIYMSDDPGLGNDADLWISKRGVAGGTFPVPTRMDSVSSVDRETSPIVSVDGRTLYFARAARGGGVASIWVAQRLNADQPFRTPTQVTELMSAGDNVPTGLPADGCTLYLSRKSGNTWTIMTARRPP